MPDIEPATPRADFKPVKLSIERAGVDLTAKGVADFSVVHGFMGSIYHRSARS
jgi:hypothetical protein